MCHRPIGLELAPQIPALSFDMRGETAPDERPLMMEIGEKDASESCGFPGSERRITWDAYASADASVLLYNISCLRLEECGSKKTSSVAAQV